MANSAATDVVRFEATEVVCVWCACVCAFFCGAFLCGCCVCVSCVYMRGG